MATAAEPGHRPREFISGGQTGADSIPFAVFERLGVALKGYLPKDFKRNDGRGREVAERYGLTEGEGGYKWRDTKNAESADACVAFLTTLPMTGKGTMQTVNLFVRGVYSFIPLDKPAEVNYLVLDSSADAQKPAIVFWDITAERLEAFAAVLRTFFNKQRPERVMFSGSTEETWPGVEVLGAELLLMSLEPSAANEHVSALCPLDDCSPTSEVACTGSSAKHSQYRIAQVASSKAMRKNKCFLVELSLGDSSESISVVTPHGNLEVGQKVVVAPEGSVVCGSTVIRSKIHGEWNTGVLCGPVEMGWLGDASSCIVLDDKWEPGDYAPAEKPTCNGAPIADHDPLTTMCSDDDPKIEAERDEGFGFDSVREAYNELGPAAFYTEQGSRYRNPHEKMLVGALCRALAEWESDNLLVVPGRNDATVAPLGRVLDLACGSGEASLALEQWAAGRPGVANDLEAADPYTYEAYERRTGRQAHRWTFEDIASAGTLEEVPVYDAILCSFCLHLLDRSWLVMTLTALARASHLLVVASPHKRPVIDTKTGWVEIGMVLQDRVHVRLFRSRVI